MMNKNMNSPTKLTEFAPLRQETSQPAVTSLFSKFFSFSKGESNQSNIEDNNKSPNADEQSSSGDSECWKGDSREKTPSGDDDSSNSMTFPLDGETSEGRSLPNVLKRISNIVALKSNNLMSYKDSHLRSYWMPDQKAKQCYECGERFTTFRRRHHCRVCGQIFCSKCCSDEIPGKIMGCTGDLRVCTYCCKVVLSYLQSSDMRSVLSADLKALQEDLQVKYGNEIPSELPKASNCLNNVTQNDNQVSKRLSVGYMEEKYASSRFSGTYLSSQERSIALQNSASLRMIYEELFRSNQSIQLQTHRVRLKSYYNCFMGNELVNWMISLNKAANRIQATAIGQALLEANYIESAQSEMSFTDSTSIYKPVNLSQMQSPNFLDENQSSCDAQEPAWVKNIPQHDSTTDSENETKQSQSPQPQSQPLTGRFPSSSSSFYLDLNLEASTVTLKRPTTCDDFSSAFADSSEIDSTIEQKQVDFKTQTHTCNVTMSDDELLNDRLQLQEVKDRNSWHKVNNLKNLFGEVSAYNSLSSAYKQHEDLLIKQLLNKENLPQSWSDVILPLIHQVIDQVRPDQNHNSDDMDIRQYVQIKKSLGGSRNDCEIMSGVVCSKNIAHRGMNAMIANPKILLLQCGLMYQRVEGKLLSLEPVMLQENEYLGHTVARIAALGPDIVMVHRSVSRLAQDRFRQCGITLVLNVKLSVLERLARCTGAKIVNTIDAHLTTRFKLGVCQKFYLRNFPNDKNGIKTLMYFEGCANPHLGSTILLRGGSLLELKKVKNVMLTMIFAGYNWRLEKSFLMDEFAKPPSPKSNSFLDETIPKNSDYDCDMQDICKSNNDENLSSNLVENSEESLKKTLSLLDEHSDSYDTLKLFKTRCNTEKKSSNGFSTEESDINEDNTVKLTDNVSIVEEKRVYIESIDDRSDPLHQYLNEDEEEKENGDMIYNSLSPIGQILSVADLPLLNKFRKALDNTVLSFSPYLKFTIPYLETEPGRNCILRQFFPNEIFYSSQFEDKIEGTKLNTIIECNQAKNLVYKLNLKPPHTFTLAKVIVDIEVKDVQSLLADFRACGNRLELTNNVILEKNECPVQINDMNEVIQKWPDCLDPLSHQRLSVLFCSFSHNSNNAPAFCVNPWIVNMDLYGRNDIALGRFLERYCLTSDYKCPASACRAQIIQHERRFAHDSGCVQIILNQMNSNPFGQENNNKILMWSKCMICKNVSPVVPMTSDTWSLSFGKYLELRFHGNIYTNRSLTDKCQHSLHHNHYQYFSKNNMFAVFKYSKISLWEISLPPPVIHIIYNSDQNINVIEEMKCIALKGDDVFTNIKDKLSTLQLDQEALIIAKQQLSKDQQYFKNKIDEVQLKLTSPTLENKKLEGKESEKHVQNLMFRIEDGIVILKRLISEAVFNWNPRLLSLANKKKNQDERPKRFSDRSSTVGSIGGGVLDTDDYITEDTASESLIEDLSPVSADYNAIDAINTVNEDASVQLDEPIEVSDNEIPDTNVNNSPNPADIVVLHDSPKSHQRSHSDVFPITSDDLTDKKKKKKTILSQLLPSTTIVTPISNPLNPTEHHLLPLGSVVPIVVYESEPSSIIAYALDSHDYKHALQEIVKTSKPINDFNSSPLNKRKSTDSKENSIDMSQSDNHSTNTGSGSGPGSVEIDEDKKAIKQQNYVEIQFADATTNFYCRIYFAAQFAALRENVLPCGEEGFTRSLCRSVQWAARGGKSGSTFCKTRDNRFILKELSRVEMQIFLDFAPNYFSYMEKCQQTKQPTLLGKIVGVYRVSFKNNTTNAALRTSVLVMENLFYARTITDKFDLKGSVRNRLVNPDDIDREGELVLLDENLLNMSCDSPLYIRSHSKDVLNKAIEQDTEFLSNNSVMDYSLLVGLEPNSDELVLGIIDYIRTFTWDKKLETMVKKSGILGGQGKLPTIVSPEEYRARFIAAMHRYFLPVPDRWTGLGRGVKTP